MTLFGTRWFRELSPPTKNTAASLVQSVNRTLLVGNRQKTRLINRRLLREIARALLVDLLQLDSFELIINVVGAAEMALLNETYLKHKGSTDVLAFNYSEPGQEGLLGELFVCTDEALIQAARFRTSWQAELVRYVVHGTLHLLGHDDHSLVERRKMKRQENRVLKALASRFALKELGKRA